jgi:hypothetical protein
MMMMTKLVFDADEMLSYIEDNYSFKNGCFYHTSSKGGMVKGARAGWKSDSRGYRRMFVLGTHQYEHRMSFLIHYGWLPDEVDHINGNKSDNQPSNLRAVSRSMNNYNKPLQPNNKSGAIGVSWHKKAGKWAVRLKENGKYPSFGLYEDKQRAISVAKTERERIIRELSNG